MLTDERAARFGVRVEKVRREETTRALRTVAVVVPDESRVSEVHTRVSGWIEQLHVNKTGQSVRAGQTLAGIFSPDLLAAQKELLSLQNAPAIGSGSKLLDGARARLGVLGMSSAQIAAIEGSGKPTRLVAVSSPRKGVVIRRTVAVGTAVDPSTELMTIADLSKVWVFAEVPERDVADVPLGAEATLEFPATRSAPLSGKVSFLYPTLNERTRTLRVRFELDNPRTVFKPGMYGTATFATSPRSALSVSRDALVDTGLEQHVFVLEGPSHYAPRKVVVGTTFGDRVEIRSGLTENETVVASGVFLIDSESRLRASGGGAAHAGHGGHGAPKGESDVAPPAPGHEGHEGLPAAPKPATAKSSPPTPPPAPVDPHAGHAEHGSQGEHGGH
jgi:Cu(I)/Ag(I) efflux system membrane fusion protein